MRGRSEVGSRVAGPSLTARERAVARLIGLGYTNRAIANELGISERTVGAHVQNILNKLGASNRAEIAARTAHDSEPRVGMQLPPLNPSKWSGSLRSSRLRTAILAACLVLVAVVTPADHMADPLAAPPIPNSLLYDVQFAPDGREFSLRYVLGAADASAVNFVDGAVDYSVLGPGGNTGNTLAMARLATYYVVFEISVKPGSDVTFWLNLTSGASASVGEYLVDIETKIQAMQMAYFTNEGGDFEAIGPQVPIRGLQTGRKFVVSALVKPPAYTIYLDGKRVIDLNHSPSLPQQSVSFSIFGNGLGTVRLSAIRVYLVD